MSGSMKINGDMSMPKGGAIPMNKNITAKPAKSKSNHKPHKPNKSHVPGVRGPGQDRSKKPKNPDTSNNQVSGRLAKGGGAIT